LARRPECGGYRVEVTNQDRREVLKSIESLRVAISARSIPRIIGRLMETQLTLQQLKVLTSVVVHEASTTSALADDFEVSLPTMSRLVDRLVKQDLIERAPDDGDQRVRRLRPTRLGRAVVAEILGARPELGVDVMDGLSLEELRALETGMRAVSRELRTLRHGAVDI
jgi:DNA-binding MarR family transcriptional regulator